MIRFRSLICILVAFFCLSLIGCTAEDGAWEEIQARGTLRVGLDPTYPPFENADGGQLVGLDVDLARALARQLNLEAEFVYFGFDGLYDALATEQVDVLISALVVDPTRTEDFAYTEPYFNAGQFLVVRGADAAAITDLTALEERTVAVPLGTDGHLQALDAQRQIPDITINPLPTADDALWVVLQNEADAAIVDHVGGRLYAARYPDLILQPKPLTVEPYAIVVRADDGTLHARLDTALETLDENGRLAEIIARWLDVPPES